MTNSDDPSGWGPAPEPGATPEAGSSAPPPPPPPPPSGSGWTPPPPPPPQGGWEQPHGGWNQPPSQGWGNQYAGYPAPAQTENSAIVALVLACASFVVCPVIPAIIALTLVPSARAKIRDSGGRLTGEGLLTATKVIAWIHLALVAAGIGVIVLIGFLGALSSSTGY